MGGEEKHRGRAVGGHKLIEAIVIGDVELIPIIEACALECAVGYLKSRRSYYVQSGAGNGTGARYVAGILRYLGVV